MVGEIYKKGEWFFLILLIALFSIFFLSELGFALTISPPRMELSGNPGTEVKGEITLFNEENEAKVLYSSIQNFEARGESGAPYFLPEKKDLATWITIEEQVSLNPGERKTIPFVVKIPQNAEPGGYFAAIFFGTAPPQVEGGQVSVSSKLGALILLRVAGEVEEKGGLLEFKTEKGRIYNSLPVVFVYRFFNDGGDRIKPEGEIRIKNVFGVTTAVLDANKGEGNVLPRSVRKLSAVWHTKNQKIGSLTKKEELAIFEKITREEGIKKGFFEKVKDQWNNFAFGPYQARLSLIYGSNNKKEEASYWFFIIPWQLLIVLILIFIVLGSLFYLGIKKYNRWIIKKAQQKSI
ncbi:MAG: DUF916 domain-containing protein [Patescibacteria group bacterium]|nr:DUF916 domain-containing protein [Patescibacteria group bacterium]